MDGCQPIDRSLTADAAAAGLVMRRFAALLRQWQFWAVVGLTAAIYLPRLTTLPVCGEESRWATVAGEMVASGDWIVPRQQGHVFAERPPLGSWAMAAVGSLRGEIDLVAIRLPSVLAVTLTVGLIYAYARLFLAPLGAAVAGLAYATAGQVLQIGRLGESEALFSLLVAASLLVWHAGYTLAWPRLTTWSAGYALAGLGALVKGPQAPIYFVTVAIVFLVWQRNWKWLFSWQHLVGVAALVAIVAAWQIPFWLATDNRTVLDVWSKLARERFSISGLAGHAIGFPLETLVCMLPWSFFLTAYFDPRFCRQLRAAGHYGPVLSFLVIALVVTYPSVWLSAGARGRYFMPLYPCLAVLIGIVVERAAAADASYQLRRGWRWYCQGIAVLLVAGSLLLIVAAAARLPALAPLTDSWAYVVPLAALSVGLAWWVFARRASASAARMLPAALATSALVGLAFDGAALTARARGMQDLTPQVSQLQSQLPAADRLVSFGPAAHRFTYYYGLPIAELPWPSRASDIPEGVEYFCFEQHPGDNAELRQNGRGSYWGTTSGTLPFRWEQVAALPYTPYRDQDPAKCMIVGRIVREKVAASAGQSAER